MLIVTNNIGTWKLTYHHESAPSSDPKRTNSTSEPLVNSNREANRRSTHNVARGVPHESRPGPLHLGAALLLVAPLISTASTPLRLRDDEVLDEHHRRRRLLH